MQNKYFDVSLFLNKLWSRRRFIGWFTVGFFIMGVLIALTTPKEYSSSASLAPEINQRTSASNLGTFASMAGLNLQTGNWSEALSPAIYPDIVHSRPFIMDLVGLEVQTIDESVNTTLYDYIDNHQKSSGIDKIKALPAKIIGAVISIFKKKKDSDGQTALDPYNLTEEQALVINAINDRIDINVDTNTGMARITVHMQDPLIAARVTDAVLHNLKDYITEYRTDKARQDLRYAEQLFQEARQDYTEAQQKYAIYVDRNQNIIRQSYRSEEERLRNELNLAFGVYNQNAQNLSYAKAKVQERTPVFAIVDPATVPVKPFTRRKVVTVFMYTVFGAFLAGVWVLLRDDLVKAVNSIRFKRPE